MKHLPNFADIKENLEFLDDWEDRYRYLIELGQMLEPLSEAEHNEDNKVHGCASQVWLIVDETKAHGNVILNFRGNSDALIVKGLVAVITSLFSGLTPSEILKIDALEILDDLNLREHLSSQRSNGLKAMVQRIQNHARSRE